MYAPKRIKWTGHDGESFEAFHKHQRRRFCCKCSELMYTQDLGGNSHVMCLGCGEVFCLRHLSEHQCNRLDKREPTMDELIAERSELEERLVEIDSEMQEAKQDPAEDAEFDGDDGQPDEQQEWHDYDPDC